jgi:hypothetical protein
MNKLNILIGMLTVTLLFLPGVFALEGESPADTFDRLTAESLVLVVAASAFFIVLGVILIIVGGASPKLRVWGAGVIVAVLFGNLVLLGAPWVLELIQPAAVVD